MSALSNTKCEMKCEMRNFAKKAQHAPKSDNFNSRLSLVFRQGTHRIKMQWSHATYYQ